MFRGAIDKKMGGTLGGAGKVYKPTIPTYIFICAIKSYLLQEKNTETNYEKSKGVETFRSLVIYLSF